MTNTVSPLGYSSPGAQERIDELLGHPKVLLIDTRIKPSSWNEAWRKEALERQYGNQYRWAGRYLGNKALGTGRIEIADPDTGINGLIGYLSKGHDLILMCQCKVLAMPEPEFNKCHVSEVVRLLLKKMPEVEVVRFEQPEKEAKPEMEPERIIICQRTGRGKGCTMTWAVGDRCFFNEASAVITQTKMEGLTQLVKIKMAVDAPLLGRRLVSDHPKWINGELLKPRGTIVPEFGEKE